MGRDQVGGARLHGESPARGPARVCISIARVPGVFGSRFHNRAYELLGLNRTYIPLGVAADEVSALLSIVRRNFDGCSVSMPYKTSVLAHLDRISSEAQQIGAVNTIVNHSGVLAGHNTDVVGATTALRAQLDLEGKPVLLLGNGGAARAIALAVGSLGGVLTVSGRNEERASTFAGEFSARFVPWDPASKLDGYLLINATSVGMNAPESMVVAPEVLERFDAIFDVVQSPLETRLVLEAARRGKIAIAGRIMCAYQAAAQFRLYTGQSAPEEVMREALTWQ